MNERKKERIVENEAKAGGRWERTGKLDRWWRITRREGNGKKRRQGKKGKEKEEIKGKSEGGREGESSWRTRRKLLVICKEEDCRLYFCLFAIRRAAGGAEGGNSKLSDNAAILWASWRGGEERGSPWKRRTRAPNTRREVYIRRGTPRRLDQKDSVRCAVTVIQGRPYQGMSFEIPTQRFTF